MNDVLDLAERFFRAVERGDIDQLRAIYAPDALIWHNHDRKEQTVEENLRVLSWVAKNLTDRHYRVQRRVAIPGGFLQQHVLEANTVGGPFSMPACIVVQVIDGRISRLEEYLDSAQAAHLANLTSGGTATKAALSKDGP
ncbi:MAG: nuclear transport factor 2 family protein [Alphaproteobacteria bacterium]|nr:nuclear transport factor 2 family protein [Alphaproteobacteria bacterium]